MKSMDFVSAVEAMLRGERMDFVSAVEAMLRGEAVTRKCWGGVTYCSMIPNELVKSQKTFEFEPLGSLLLTTGESGSREYTACLADVLADDWEIVMSERSAA